MLWTIGTIIVVYALLRCLDLLAASGLRYPDGNTRVLMRLVVGLAIVVFLFLWAGLGADAGPVPRAR